jgi:hypothetical protein
MFTIPRHDSNRNVTASAAQRHIPHPPTANSACVAAILNSGDHSAGPCTNTIQKITSCELLAKKAKRKKFIIFIIYVHMRESQ